MMSDLVPLPGMDPEPSPGTPSRTGQDAVTAACDKFRELGIPVPRAHLAILGRHAKTLLEDGFDFEVVAVSCVIALRRVQPHHLQYIAADIVTARGGLRMTRREYERAMQDEAELGRRR